MRNRSSVIAFIVSFAIPFAASAASVGLEDAFRAALKRSEDLSTQQENIVQAEERLRQAIGAILPSVNGVYAYLHQPTPAGSFSSVSPADQTTTRLTLTQPLFRGLRDFAALRQGKFTAEAARLKEKQVIHQIFEDLVASYFQVLSTENDLRNVQNEIVLNQKRLKELEEFNRLGRTRPSEVLTLQSNIASLEAQQEGIRGQIRGYRAIFAFLTGLDPNVSVYDSEPVPGKNKKLDFYLGRVESRPDIQALNQSFLASQESVSIAKGAHLPSLDFQADYFFQRPGFLSNVNWDIQFIASMPIFAGGSIQSQVRQAVSGQNQAELALSKARRQAEKDIETYFSLYQADYSQLEKQKKAVDLAMKTYDVDRHDYRMGLVTNIEVLGSLTSFQESQRLLDRIKYQLKADFIRLESVSAIRPSTR